ncbi:TonB-dependent siderophore receptor [Curvibacter sp. HBC28]|uniref:TonB-dependent siderophore receptor n=1 Tax=Curvibacter microcysteis TaxID=3026419 RepID=A0ABT5MD44_9BURK|nr:TonB-dependent siderophore receptor [Curvibacter sp. HBC28]MDD0814505.1 TonB-dependent siderophore receptor [Curvibacter sp. HBC28]
MRHLMPHHLNLRPATATGLAVSLLLANLAWAQQAPAEKSLPAVQVSERNAAPVADVTGFGDVPAREVPISTTVIDRAELDRVGARRLADLTQLDASVTDGYNAPGYWDTLNIRGYTLNQNYNYRREGLPISAETVIPLDNKERIEILKGTSGLQSGTSSPGGLVNYVVKRPTETPLREVTLSTGERGSRLLALDLGGRSENKVLGYRLNIAHEDMRPLINNTNGRRDLLAFAGDARLSRDTVLSAELEWSQQTQASVPGQSLLGSQLPSVRDPNINLNNQPWSKPNEFRGLTGTVKLDQAINNQWSWQAVYGSQRLKSNDRLAYPFGCYDASSGAYYADRYCPSSSTGKAGVGLADIYQFESNNERRQQQALQWRLQGNTVLAGVPHQVSTGLLRSVLNNRFDYQADGSAAVGQATTDGLTVIPAPNPPLAFNSPNTNRDEYNTELFVQDMARWTPRLSSWAGLRHTALDRHSVQNSGGRETRYRQSFTSPWLGLSYDLGQQLSVYGSWGRGVESSVVPNRAYYANAGTGIPAAQSTQKEVGLKHASTDLNWQLSYFDIRRPALYESQISDAALAAQLCPSSSSDCRTQSYNGDAHHRGLEASASTRLGDWRLNGSALLLRAVRHSADATLNGLAPTNVPKQVLRAHAEYRIAQVPGLSVGGGLTHEGSRKVVSTSTEQVDLPAWTRFDAQVRLAQKHSDRSSTVWLFSVDNLFNRSYWRESPTSFGHVYLYPGAARTLRLTMKTSF